MGETNIYPDIKKTFPWKLAVIFLLFSAVIILLGIYYYRYERNRIFEEQEKSLSSIASLKIKQISQWYSDKLADAVVIKDNEPLVSRIKQFLKDDNQTGIRKEITIWLEALNKQYDYNSVALLDTLLRVRISTSGADPLADDSIRAELNSVIRYHKIIMTDLHKGGTRHAIRMDLLVPLLDPLGKEQKTIALVILCIDPDKILFPLVQSWPTPSKSSETLILRREGDSVQYLNELRHRKNTALNLKFPLSKVNLLATKAVNGFEGVTEGIDYRNIHVIGALSKIPELPWFMVAKTDKEEILAPFIRYSFITVFVIILLILINASIFGFWIWQQRINFYKNQLKSEISIRELEERFTTAFRMSPVSVTISSVSDNKFIDVNNTFLQDMEYTRGEVIGRTAKELNIWADEGEREWIINEISKKGKIFGKVISYKTRTGKILYGLSSMSVVQVNGIPCNLSTVVNITERRKSEEKLVESEELFRKLFENMLNGFAYCKMIYEDGKPLDFLYLNVNEAFATLTGLKDVMGKRVSEAIPGIQEADPELLERYNRVSSTGTPEVFEIYVESLKMWFSISVYSPQKGYFVAVFDVITARKLADEKLHESRSTLQSIIDNSNSLIYLVDTEGRFVLVNQPLQQLLTASGEQMIGQTREAFLPREIANLHRKNDLEVITSGKTQIFEEENIEPDGKHYYLTTKFPLYDNENIIYSVGGLSTDITEQKLVEQALRISEERYRNIFNSLIEGFCIIDMVFDEKNKPIDYRFLEINTSFDKQTGLHDAKGKLMRELAPNHESYWFEIYGKVALTGETVRFENEAKALNRWFEVRASRVDEQEGRKVAIYFNDITERKLSEMVLRESEDKFKYIFDHSLIPKSITLPSGEINVNRAFCDMLGYQPKELKKINWADISHPDDIKLTNDSLNLILSGKKKSARFTKRYIHKNGSVIWADVGTSLRRDDDNNPQYFMTSVNDITERRAAEEALRDSEERFSKSFRTSPISFIIANMEDGRIIEINDAFTGISGFTHEEAIGNTTLNLNIWVHEEDRKHMIDSLSKGKAILHMETMLRAKEGKIAIVLLSAQVIKLANRNCIISSIEDITERKNAESQIKKLNEELEDRVIQRTELLEAANKELEAFSYSVSHDLRAPLRSVHGYTKILMEEYESMLDEEGKRICGIISSSATQMGGLIDDLLSFSRIGRTSMNPSQLDMKSIVKSVFEEICPDNQKSRTNLKIGKLHKAYGDGNLLKLVWTNLISNAIKYSSKKSISEISVGSQLKYNKITYFVKDNGVGFDMKYKHKLFGVFQRLHSESEFEGNGVGLAIIQRIILKHGGNVWAEGEEGKGATFYFSLPVQDKRQK